MSKEAAVQPVKDEVKAPKVAIQPLEKSEPAAAKTKAPEAPKQTATAAAAKTVSAKPKAAIKAVSTKTATKDVAEPSAPATKPPTKAVKKAPAAAKEKVVEVSKTEKAPKVKKQAPKKPKLIRDSFTVPEADYALFATLKQRALAAGVEVKKSEILRAAVVALANLNDPELIKAFGLVERIKTGRPKK